MSQILSPPKNSRAEILAALIQNPEISEQQFRLNGFRSRISELVRAGVPVKDKFVTRKNRRGNYCTFKVRYLFSIDIPRARKLYAKINN